MEAFQTIVCRAAGICHASAGALKFVILCVKGLNYERINPLAR
jgi:hypothetical protein